MNSKVIMAINKMVEKSQYIRNVIPGIESTSEYFFTYDEKYKWSITCSEDHDDYALFYYKMEEHIQEIARTNVSELTYIPFYAKSFNSKEAYQSFADLYETVKSKALGMDSVLDDIISDDDDDFEF